MTDSSRCPKCGGKILSSVRTDFCENIDDPINPCDYGVYYPSAF